jgi:hypothetical protein
MKLSIVICAGLPRSASTWVFNAARELLGENKRTFSVFSDGAPALATEMLSADYVVIKSHIPDEALLALASSQECRTIVTVRDPLDCIASLMTQFRFPFERALEAVKMSARALSKLIDSSPHLLLRYEDADTRSARTLGEIANFLGWPKSLDTVGLASKLSRESVSKFVGDLEASGYFDDRPPAEQWHTDTHWHPYHIGDGRTGKFQEVLSPDQVALAAYEMRELRLRLGYPAVVPVRIKSGETLAMGQAGSGFIESGFASPEGWGVWTEGAEAHLVLLLAEPATSIGIEIDCVTGPVFRPADAGEVLKISVNGRAAVSLIGRSDFPPGCHIGLGFDLPPSDQVRLTFQFTRTLSPKDAGIGLDDRTIGLGLRTLRVTYQ